jgi:hypothetical protein
MADYRAYVLGKDGRRFQKVAEFSGNQPNDAAAMNAAKKLVDRHDVELWDVGRLVCRFAAEDHPKTLRDFTSETVSIVPAALVVENKKETGLTTP